MVCRSQRDLLMIRQGHVRLLVALLAAVSLHALLLMRTDDSSLTITAQSEGDLLQVALLAQAERPHKPVKREAKQPSNPASELTLRRRAIPMVEQGIQDVEEETSESSVSPESEDVVMAQVPAAVQSIILAKVDYPRQARRRGYEGKAEFRFDVSRQAVQQVSMLVSSGYPVLDKAARKGLLSVGSLPLNDGSYRLPVIFRLQ